MDQHGLEMPRMSVARNAIRGRREGTQQSISKMECRDCTISISDHVLRNRSNGRKAFLNTNTVPGPMPNYSWCGRAGSAVPLLSAVRARRTARRSIES